MAVPMTMITFAPLELTGAELLGALRQMRKRARPSIVRGPAARHTCAQWKAQG